jgi:hypothetical protein
MTGRDHALDTLERVRANDVQRARAEVAERALVLSRAEVVLHECQRAHARAAEALAIAVRTHVELLLPKELVWAERHLRALRLDVEAARLRSLRAQAQFEDSGARLAKARDGLRTVELGRRAVATVLERGRNEAALVHSRRQEDESDETFRGRAG